MAPRVVVAAAAGGRPTVNGAGGGAAFGGAPPGGAHGRRGGGGAAGGLLNGSTPSAALTAMLEKGSDGYRWVAAAIGANSAAGYQLASDQPIMAIGGFNGTDPTPTLAQFEQYVADGDIHYFIGGGGGLGGGVGGGGAAGTTSTSSQIR